MIHKRTILLSTLVLLVGAALAIGVASAQRSPRATNQVSPMHPTFALLDENGANVLESGAPVSPIQTCGQCHDAEFITTHSFHADLGLSDYTTPGNTGSGRPWDTSPGLFGKWNPLTYRYLSAEGDERLDLSTPDWLKEFGARVVGSGPAVTSRDGHLLSDAPPNSTDPDVISIDPRSQEIVPWDWQATGSMEMNCFLCHLTNPNNAARQSTIQKGKFGWATTATLLGTGIVEQAGQDWQWNKAAFSGDGELAPEFVTIQDPTNENCAQCHGLVHSDLEQPLVLAGCDLENWQTATTGQVISPQKISESGANLSGKDSLTRSWDVHAERGLQCTDCHYSLNNPVQYAESPDTRPEHLQFDPRRLEIGEYLQQPDHNFARGQSAQHTIAPELKDTMRRCESCHDTANTHDWLPYTERHMAEVACETCHIPQVYAPAVQAYDWTVLKADGRPMATCRGVDSMPPGPNQLVTSFQPALLPRQNVDGESLLAPYNLVTAWYWIYEDANGNTRPVRLQDLKAAWFDGEVYAPGVVSALDQDGSGSLEEAELLLDTPEKQAVIAGRLQTLGLENPRIEGEIQPYSINHNVARGEWVTRDCQTCHSDDSLIAQSVELSASVPGGVLPEFVQDANTTINGSLYTEQGALYYRPATRAQQLYIFGHDRVRWIDALGALFFASVLFGVSGHSALRFYASVRSKPEHGRKEKVYMYSVYERFWHWLQTIAIVLLLFTGLIIHRPDLFSIFSFQYVVVVHNVLAALLVANAGLSLFYHLASGEIRQYIPRPYGFFDQAVLQAKYYLQGIFQRGGHPFEKTPDKKLNPLQQITYFGILNVLLPLQILTGALMWGVQRWPFAASWLGGLPLLAPFHSLIAWLFASFIVAHVYLTTTGAEPLTSIQAMINGWDEVEFQLEDAQPGEVDLPTSPPTPAQDEIPDFHSQKPETGAAPASD
jgi:thiosulfate reductase cytochrome b subunit